MSSRCVAKGKKQSIRGGCAISLCVATQSRSAGGARCNTHQLRMYAAPKKKKINLLIRLLNWLFHDGHSPPMLWKLNQLKRIITGEPAQGSYPWCWNETCLLTLLDHIYGHICILLDQNLTLSFLQVKQSVLTSSNTNYFQPLISRQPPINQFSTERAGLILHIRRMQVVQSNSCQLDLGETGSHFMGEKKIYIMDELLDLWSFQICCWRKC